MVSRRKRMDSPYGARARGLIDDILSNGANEDNPEAEGILNTIFDAFAAPVPPERRFSTEEAQDMEIEEMEEDAYENNDNEGLIAMTDDEYERMVAEDTEMDQRMVREENEDPPGPPVDAHGERLIKWDLVKALHMCGNIYEGEYGRWVSYIIGSWGGATWHHQIAWGGSRPRYESGKVYWGTHIGEGTFEKVGHLEKFNLEDGSPYIGDVVYFKGGSMGRVVDIGMNSRVRLQWLRSHRSEEWVPISSIKRIARIGRSKKQIF